MSVKLEIIKLLGNWSSASKAAQSVFQHINIQGLESPSKKPILTHTENELFCIITQPTHFARHFGLLGDISSCNFNGKMASMIE